MSEPRTLGDIIDAAKDGSPTTHEECLYALLAYNALHTFDHRDLMEATSETPKKYPTPTRRREESFRRYKTALAKPPREWVGWNNDPANPDVVVRVKVARRLFDKIANEDTP